MMITAFSLNLKAATMEDSGDYTLTARNEHGEKSTTVMVLVKGKTPKSALPVSDQRVRMCFINFNWL